MSSNPEVLKGYTEAIKSNDPVKIREVIEKYPTLSPEERLIVQSAVNDAYASATQPAKSELEKLRSGIPNIGYNRPPNRNISAWKNPDVTPQAPADLASGKDAAHEGVSDLVSEKSLGTLKDFEGNSVTAAQALTLAERTMADRIPVRNHNENYGALNSENLKKYQENHGIGIDGRIGKETYLEMEALNILASAQDRVEELGISEKTQERIKWFISQGNLGTKNAQKLILWINEERNKNPEDFDRKYPGLYNHIQSEHQKYTSSEKGQSQIQSAEENMDSIYETVMDPNKSWSEKIGVIAKDPLILFAAGTLFLFGVFGSDSKYTNSFMKRLGWLVGGALFGPALWRKIGVDDALNDLNDFTSSPEFQSGIQSGRQGVQDAIDQAYNGISSIDTTQVGETFDTIWNNIKGVHTQLLERGSGSVSDENLTKFTELTGIEAFLNISKSDLAQINDYNGLLAKIGQENMEKLGFSPEDSDDIKKFIHDYFLPQMGVNDIFVKDLFLSESLKGTVGNMVELTGRSYFPNNATLNEIIKTDISNITLGVNDTLKLAGEKIKTALLTGNFESIQIDNFPSLSENEKSQVKKIIDKINYVLEIEGENGYIHNTQSAITNINLVAETGNSGETKETLNRKLQSLEGIHREYLSRIEAEKTIAKDYDVDSNIFSWSVLESAYMQKKIEILNNAQAKGILTLGGENVATVLQGLETNTKLAEDIEKLNGYIEFLKNTPLPGYEASPKEFLEIYDSLKEIFDDTNTYSNNNDPQIVTLRDAILSFKDTMQDQYESIRQRSDNESNELKEKIAMFSLNNINTFDDFNQLKSDWEDLAQEFESLSESLVPGYTLPDVGTLWERWSAEIPALDSQEDENILNVLDRDFGLGNSQRIQLEDIQRLLDAKKQLILEKRDEVIRIQLEKELQSITLDKINQATIQPAVDFMLKFQENEEVQNTLRTSLNMDANGEIDMSQTNIYDLLAIVDMISQIPINGEDPEDLLQEGKFVRDQVLGLLNGDIIPRLSLGLQELLESTGNGIQNIGNYISYIISN